MKNPHDIILRPVLTEKGYDGIADKRYVFEVAVKANKVEIKQALEAVFKDIKVQRSTPCAPWARSSARAVPRAALPKSRRPMSPCRRTQAD
jgi:hypothetical protein